jgi:hypothetical protein
MRGRVQIALLGLIGTLLVAVAAQSCGGNAIAANETPSLSATTTSLATTASVATAEATTEGSSIGPDAYTQPEDAAGLAELAVIRDAIAQAGVSPDFQIYGHQFSNDGTWAGVTILTPDIEILPVLLFHSPTAGWQVKDWGMDMTYQDVVDQGAPAELANFLTCFT